MAPFYKHIQALGMLLFLMFAANAAVLTVLPFYFIRFISEKLWLGIATQVQEAYLRLFVFATHFVLNVHLRVTGTIPKTEGALVICNHLTHDWFIMYPLAFLMGSLGYVRTVIKKVVQYVPGFGWSMWMFYWPFVSRNYEKDKAPLTKLFNTYGEHKLPVQVWIYPESTRRTLKKLAASQEYAKEKGLPHFRHVMLPRHRGFQLAATSLKKAAAALHDLTISYEGYGTSTPSLWQLLTADTSKTHTLHVDISRVPLNTVPVDDDASCKEWLLQRFKRKDDLLEEFCKNGKFPGQQLNKPVRLGMLWLYPIAWTIFTVCFYATCYDVLFGL